MEPSPPHVAEEMLLADPTVIFLLPANPLGHRASVKLEDLTDLLWLVPVQASPFHELMVSLFQAAGIPWPHRSIRTNSLAFGEELVVRLDAVMLGSQLHLTRGSPCRVVPLASVSRRRIGLRYRRTTEPTPIASAVMNELRKLARERSAG